MAFPSIQFRHFFFIPLHRNCGLQLFSSSSSFTKKFYFSLSSIGTTGICHLKDQLIIFGAMLLLAYNPLTNKEEKSGDLKSYKRVSSVKKKKRRTKQLAIRKLQ